MCAVKFLSSQIFAIPNANKSILHSLLRTIDAIAHVRSTTDVGGGFLNSEHRLRPGKERAPGARRVVAAMTGTWCSIVIRGSQDRGLVGFRVVGLSPTVVGWRRCNRTRRPGTQPNSDLQPVYPLGCEGQNKDPVGSIFFCCVCLWWRRPISRNCSVLLLTVHCLHIRD